MEIRIGPPAVGGNFYKRPKLIAKLLRALERGNVAFLGPRRTGKTSCLEEIRANPGDFLPIYLNLESHDTVEAWLREMLEKLRKALAEPQSQWDWAKEATGNLLGKLQKIEITGLGKLELGGGKAGYAWRGTADVMLELLVETEVPVLFLIDEFPTFLTLLAKREAREGGKGGGEVEAVLNWFRAARHSLKERRTRFLVTGSIGLKGVVRKMGLAPAVNEFDTHEIPPLEDAEALGLLEELAKSRGLELTTAGRKKILALLGANWPILLQLFISEIEEAGFEKAPTVRELEAIYLDALVNGSRNQYCDGMHDRLKETFSASECQLAREILKATCRVPEGLGRADFEAIHERLVPDANHRVRLADEFDHVIDTLKHDGYLLQRKDGEQRTTFASNILRDFWVRKTS